MDIGQIIGGAFFGLMVAIALYYIIREIVSEKRRVNRSWFMYAGGRFNPWVDDKRTNMPILPDGWHWNVTEDGDRAIVSLYEGEHQHREYGEHWTTLYKPKTQVYNMAFHIMNELYKENTPKVNPRAHLFGNYPPKSL